MKYNFTTYWIYKLMRIALYQLIIMMTCVGICLAGENYAQTVLEKEVSISYQNTTIKEILKGIEEQTKVRFAYSGSYTNLDETVSYEAKAKTLKEVLDQLLAPHQISYEVQNEYIILTSGDSSEDELEKAITLLNEEIEGIISPITIKGKVTDSEGKPLPNATIMIKGTLKGITTDLEGNYTITVPDSETVLIFSYVGFAKQEVKVEGQTIINVTLEPSATELEEVTINAGYYTVTEREKTGSISRVAAKDIENVTTNNLLQTLQGRMTGVRISGGSGLPGSGYTIKIRGLNSVRPLGNDPFYIIDGIPFPPQNLSGRAGAAGFTSPLSVINPSDIESVEVLKDADATAIYGSQGANGVILITTKKGKAGKPSYNFKISTGFGKLSSKTSLLNTPQYLEMRREAFANDGKEPTSSNAPDLVLWDQNRYTDWQDELLGGTARTDNYQVSVSGGNSNFQFLLNGSYYRETTIYPEADKFPYQKGTLLLNLNHQSDNNKFNINLSTIISRDNVSLPRTSLYNPALTLAPNAPEPFDEEGNLNWEDGTWRNPYALFFTEFSSKSDLVNTKLNLKYRPFKDFEIESNFGYRLLKNDISEILPIASFNPFENFGEPGINEFINSEEKTWIVEPQINYTKKIGKLDIRALVGTTFRESKQKSLGIKGRGFANDVVIKNFAAASSLTTTANSFTEYKYNAFFGRIGLNYENRFIANISGRRDGSSRFGTGNKFGNFGAIGIAWIFSNEDFFKNSQILSHGKIRSSIGTVGNDQIGNYQYNQSYVSNPEIYSETNPLVPIRLGNPNYQWEKTKKFDLAIDLGLFEDKFFISANYFNNESSNQLINQPLPSTTGFNGIIKNLPAEIKNYGWEFELKINILKTDNFFWTSNLNISVLRNKLMDFPGLENSSFANQYVIGEPLTVRKVYQINGVNPETGIYEFEDFDGDGQISYTNDRELLINVSPKFFGGLQSTLKFHQFEFDFFLRFVKQKGANYLTVFNSPGRFIKGGYTNQPKIVLDRWKEAGNISNIQQFTQSFGPAGIAGYYAPSSNIAYEDRSYIRLQNVSLSYQLSQRLCDKLKIKGLRLFLQGQNLFTITGFNFLDPEIIGALPPLRMITTGIDLTF